MAGRVGLGEGGLVRGALFDIVEVDRKDFLLEHTSYLVLCDQ